MRTQATKQQKQAAEHKKIDLELAAALRREFTDKIRIWRDEASRRRFSASTGPAKYRATHRQMAKAAEKMAEFYVRRREELDTLIAAQKENE